MSVDSAAYEAKITAGIFRAFAEAGVVGDEGARELVVLSDDALNVLTSTIAILMAGAEKCSSPTKTRKFCDELARRLQLKIAHAKLSERSFMHYVQMGAPH